MTPPPCKLFGMSRKQRAATWRHIAWNSMRLRYLVTNSTTLQAALHLPSNRLEQVKAEFFKLSNWSDYNSTNLFWPLRITVESARSEKKDESGVVADNRSSDSVETQAKLRSSQQRVADLELELSLLKQELFMYQDELSQKSPLSDVNAPSFIEAAGILSWRCYSKDFHVLTLPFLKT